MSLLSVYYAPGHQRPGDLDYIRKLQPNVIRILEPDVNDIAKCHAVAPNALIQPRFWWLDDGNREQYAAMVRDPVGTGKRHASEWKRELTRLHREASERQLKIPLDLLATGVNEPDTNQAEIQIVEYTRVFLSELAEQGIQGGALCLSVGHPTRLKANGRVDWSAYMALEDVITQGKHYVVLHEYWQQEGPFHGDDWGYLAGRHHDCPFNAPIIIGEAGIEGSIYNRHPRNVGWREFVSSEHFAAMVRDFCNRVDDRVQGVCLFLTDYKDNFWASFDTEPAHGALLAVRGQIKASKPPVWGIPGPVVPRPQPGETGTTMWVNSPDGLKIRSGPGVIHAQVGGLEHGASVTVYEVKGEDQPWARVDTGWVAHWLLSDRPPAPVAPTPPVVEPMPPVSSGDCWARAYPFILRWEGGWADHPSDPGGATMKGITIGTYTRWRAAHGQPQPTKSELRNISDGEVEAIYREWYWKASGADKLPWPLCLAVFDTAVNGGVGRAQDILARSGGDFLRFMGILIDWYTRIDNFEYFGRAWIRRRAEILLEAAK